MKMKQILAPLAFVAMGMFATASYAVGELTGVTAPGSAVQGASVNIQVQGNGFCGSSITFGDGGSDSTGSSLFPHNYSHSYGSTGIKTITVNATGAGCSGSANTDITITAPPGNVTGIIKFLHPHKGKVFKIKVTGTGICEKLRVRWKNTGPTTTYNNYNLENPYYVSHTYTSTGSKKIRAYGLFSCTGAKNKWVTVEENDHSHTPWVIAGLDKLVLYKPWLPKPCKWCPKWVLLALKKNDMEYRAYARQAKRLMAKKRASKRDQTRMKELARLMRASKGKHARLIRQYKPQRQKRMRMK